MWIAAVDRKDWNICGFVVPILSMDLRATILFLLIMCHQFLIISKVQKRENLPRIWRDMSEWRSLKRKGLTTMIECLQAQSLLELSEVGNGSEFCEPHSASFTSTSLSMSDIEDLECNLQKFQMKIANC